MSFQSSNNKRRRTETPQFHVYINDEHYGMALMSGLFVNNIETIDCITQNFQPGNPAHVKGVAVTLAQINKQYSLDVMKLLYKKLPIILTIPMHVSKTNYHFLFHNAAKIGNLEVVRWILQIDRNQLNSQESNGATALHWACWAGHIHVVQFLIDQQPDLIPTIIDNRQHSCLDDAIESNHVGIVTLLLQQVPSLLPMPGPFIAHMLGNQPECHNFPIIQTILRCRSPFKWTLNCTQYSWPDLEWIAKNGFLPEEITHTPNESQLLQVFQGNYGLHFNSCNFTPFMDQINQRRDQLNFMPESIASLIFAYEQLADVLVDTLQYIYRK